MPLIRLKANLLLREERWGEAAHEYERWLRYETRPAAFRFRSLELAHLYRVSRRLADARRVVDELIEKDPQDTYALEFRRSLDLPTGNGTADAEGQRAGAQRVYVGGLIEHDLQRAKFRDPLILKKGGTPGLADARRLVRAGQLASDRLGADPEQALNDDYPLYLEAAKAFAILPAGSYDPDEFLRAVARFACARGWALVSEFRAQSPAHAGEDMICSPKTGPGGMRVSEAPRGQETNHEATHG